MSTRSRLWTVFAAELVHLLKRPMFWSLLGLLALLTWGMSTGSVMIGSGSETVGGRKAWITSEFSVAFILTVMVPGLVGFFAAITAGLTVIEDGERKVGEVLHSTPLRPREYIWGKALAVYAAFLVALFAMVSFMIFFNHAIPRPGVEQIYGPLDPWNYYRPALVFGVSTLAFFIGVPFYLGERTRRPLAAIVFPIAVLVACMFFLWNWNPTWLDPQINQALMLADPGGVRWLTETWLKRDLGAEFYNTARIGVDVPFLLSRIGWFAIGLVAVALAARRFERGLRRSEAPKKRRLTTWLRRLRRRPATAARPAASSPAGALVMSARPPGIWRGIGLFAREELGYLLREPAVFLFGFFIVAQVLGTSLLTTGAFGTPVLQTPGLLAAGSAGTLTFMTCLMLMFFTGESLQREASTGTLAMVYSSPARSFSLLLGKALGNSVLGVIMAVAVFLGCAIALAIQGTVALSLTPFLIVWGLLVLPTFLLWTSFVTAVQAVTGNRYATYGVALGVFGYTAYKAILGELTWLTNWPLWGALRWSDMSLFEVDRQALVLNRLLALALTVFFCAVAVRFFQRRAFDSTRLLERLRPRALGAGALRLAPWATVPAVLAVMLYLAVADGTEGKTAEKAQKDYWKQNLATWRDAEHPSLVAIDVDLELEPERRWLRSRGTFELVNELDQPLRSFALTGGPHWQDLSWTLDGEAYEPEDRSGLYVFTPPEPMAVGEGALVGFDFQGRFPDGVTKNGGDVGEFVLPSGVVLNSFSPSFLPVLGYLEQIGVDDDNRYEPRVYPDDFFEERLRPFIGVASPFTTRVRITAPAAYTMNSVGVLESDEVENGRRTVVWRSDHPVRFANVVGAKWAVHEGESTRIFYHPDHAYNVEEMSRVADAARRHFSEWYYPYPWRELKISEFPALANYAQGFATNIPFSEGIGFLTRGDEKTDAVAMVTAHEIAHQWWGNILTPGEGPGGNLLSEGMAHFATLMLMEELKGEQGRIELAKRFEERYESNRRHDAERPLVEIDGSRPGDTTVTYDKAGWVFWMTMEHLGRERMLAALRAFIETYQRGPDYPVLQDFLATLRPYAPDPEAFDRFADQWYHEVVLPELELGEPEVRETAGGWRVAVDLTQAGTGTVPVTVAATSGERFTEGGEPDPAYRDARATVVLDPDETRRVEILAPFEPERVVVDPDARLLQLRRKQAVAEL